MARINLNSYGVVLDVEVEDETLQPAVDLILPPGWEPSQEFPEDGHFTLSGREDAGYAVLADGEPVGVGLGADVAVHVLDAQLRLRVAANARDHIFVHAGVVALANQALVLPGPTFCGKSTLVSALVSEGATYYSDEFAVLDEAGSVHPYARRLSLRREGQGYGDYTTVEALGGQAAEAPARPAIIALAGYVPGERWQPETRAHGFGALSLLKNAVPARERPQASLQAVTRAVAGALILEGNRGEARETAGLLMATLEGVGASAGG